MLQMEQSVLLAQTLLCRLFYAPPTAVSRDGLPRSCNNVTTLPSRVSMNLWQELQEERRVFRAEIAADQAETEQLRLQVSLLCTVTTACGHMMALAFTFCEHLLTDVLQRLVECGHSAVAIMDICISQELAVDSAARCCGLSMLERVVSCAFFVAWLVSRQQGN